MRVSPLLFASLRDQLGPSVSVEVPEDVPGVVTAGALRSALEAAHPEVARYGRRLLLAVNEQYARDDSPIRSGDQVALIPPVAGG